MSGDGGAHGATSSRAPGDTGSTPIELVLGIAALLLPATVVVVLLPTWSERQSMAVVAATEAARTMALADSWAVGHPAALQRVEEVSANHGLVGAIEGVTISGDLVRGGTVTAAVMVELPVTTVPFMGHTGGWTWTARHTEPVDPYRSFTREKPP